LALFGFHLVQALWLLIPLQPVSYFSAVIDQRLYRMQATQQFSEYALLFHGMRAGVVLILALLVYGYYVLVSRIGQRATLHHAFRSVE
jgi:hypothetical protein